MGMTPGLCDPTRRAGLRSCLAQSLGVSASPSAKRAGGAPCRPAGRTQAAGTPGAFPGGPSCPLDSPFSCAQPSSLTSPNSHPGRRSAYVGTREPQQRLCAQVTTPLSLVNGWVAKTARSNGARAPSPSARCRAPPPQRPRPPTPPQDLPRWPEPEAREMNAVCPSRACRRPLKAHGALGHAGVPCTDKLRLRAGVRKTDRGTQARSPTQGLTSPYSQPRPYLEGCRDPPP